ncbi:unnamed protein product, partial [Mesorhabditis spiculigera]
MNTKLALLLLGSIGMALCRESSGYGLGDAVYGGYSSGESSGEASGYASGESSGQASAYGTSVSGDQGSGSSGESSGQGHNFDDGEGSGLSSGEILQDDLIVGPDGSRIERLFIKEDGSGHSVEGSFDPLDRIIEDVRIHGSNGKDIRRVQLVQPGVGQTRGRGSGESSGEASGSSGESSGQGNDDGEGSGLSSGEILQDDLIVGPDGSHIERLFIKEDGSGHSVEGSFDPLDRIVEDVRIHGSNGKDIRRVQLVQPGVSQTRERDNGESSGEGSGSSGESSGQGNDNDDGEGSGLSSGEILQDDLIVGPDGSRIERLFIKEDGSGHSVEGSFDPLDRIIEDVRIHGSNGKDIRRVQLVQPGVSHTRAARSAPVQEENLTDGSGEDKECVAAAACESAGDCNGGSCVGFFPGKCDCSACITGLPCKDDSACGGLKDSCDTTIKICRCAEAFAKHGFPSLGMAFGELCNVKTCEAGDCLGLPCNKGLCACTPKAN